MLKTLDKALERVNTLYDRLEEPWRIIAAMILGAVILRIAQFSFWFGALMIGAVIVTRAIHGDKIVLKYDLSQHRG